MNSNPGIEVSPSILLLYRVSSWICVFKCYLIYYWCCLSICSIKTLDIFSKASIAILKIHMPKGEVSFDSTWTTTQHPFLTSEPFDDPFKPPPRRTHITIALLLSWNLCFIFECWDSKFFGTTIIRNMLLEHHLLSDNYSFKSGWHKQVSS
jgi:hypothetical protein